MNPLLQLRALLIPPVTNTTGTVIGMQGNKVQVRTQQGIQLVSTDKLCTLGSNVTLDPKGSVLSVLEDNQIPSYRV